MSTRLKPYTNKDVERSAARRDAVKKELHRRGIEYAEVDSWIAMRLVSPSTRVAILEYRVPLMPEGNRMPIYSVFMRHESESQPKIVGGFVDEEARVHPTAKLGPAVVVSGPVIINKGVQIHGSVVVEADSRFVIPENSYLSSQRELHVDNRGSGLEISDTNMSSDAPKDHVKRRTLDKLAKFRAFLRVQK